VTAEEKMRPNALLSPQDETCGPTACG
jgi:hypothetical protein